MFKNVKYIDPKLYLPNNQPDINKLLEPSDWRSLCGFIEDCKSNLEIKRINLEQGLVGYDNTISGYEVFTNTMEYYHSIQYDENNYVILNSIAGEQSPASNYDHHFTTIIKGYIYIDVEGTYYFSCRGDDCHAFCIDGKTFLYNSGTSDADGSIYLNVGYHPIEYYQREWEGGRYYYLYWRRPGESSWTLASNVFYHSSDMVFYEKISSDGYVVIEKDVFKLKVNMNGVSQDSDENIKIDKIYGLSLSGYRKMFGSGEGRSIDAPADYKYEQDGNGNISFTSSSDFRTKFYCFKLKAGVTYTFSRSTNYDDQVWFYNSDKSYDNVNRDGTGTFTKLFDGDSICYLEVGGYNRDRYGWTSVNISPIPEFVSDIYKIPDKRFLCHNSNDYSNSSSLVYGQGSFTHSIWYYRGDEVDGAIISLEKNGDVVSCVYFDDGELNLMIGQQNYPITYSFENSFNKRGLNSPVNIIFSYDFDTEYVSLYIDGTNVISVNATMDTTFNELLIGFSSAFATKDKYINGTLKWFRSYDRVLTQEEINSISSEFNHGAGDGSTWNLPLGRIPEKIDDDTAYIIKSYNDGTVTYINSGTNNIYSMGLYNASQITEQNFNNIPNSVRSCPWLSGNGKVILTPLYSDSVFSSSTLSTFYMRGIDLIRSKYGSDPMFTFGISSNDSYFTIDNCRFSADGCNIDDSNSTSWNENAGRYMRFTGTVGNLIIKNSTIVHTSVYYDAFQILNCLKMVIRNVNVYTTTCSGSQYNGFCFGFIRGNDSYNYDDYYSYTGNSYVNMLDVKNVKMKIRRTTNSYIPGLLMSVSCGRLRMKDVDIEMSNSISYAENSPNCFNGLICVMGTYDYKVENINVSLPDSSRVSCWPLVSFFVTEPSLNSSYTQGTEQYHLIDGVNITMGNNASIANSDGERTYYTTSDVRRYFNYYSAFGVYSDDDPLHSVHVVKNINIYSPRSSAASLCGVGCSIDNLNGTLRVRGSNVSVKNFTNIFGNCAINLWDNGEVNIDNLSVDNYSYGNLVNYNSSNGYLNSHIYIKRCNKPINSFNFNRSNGGNNNAFIYCPNTKVTNGFYMRGMSHLLLPVDIHRKNGHGVSLRLGKTGSQSMPFRFPPLPYDGLSYSVTSGDKKMTVYFSEGQTNIGGQSYENWVKNNNLFIEVETSDMIYNSKYDGIWSDDESEWSSELLRPFKYTLNLHFEEGEKVYVRVYYNMDSNANGGVFMDPQIEWE